MAAVDTIWDGPRNKKGNRIWFPLDRGSDFAILNGPAPFQLGLVQFEWNEMDPDYATGIQPGALFGPPPPSKWDTVMLAGPGLDYPHVAQDGSRNIADVTDTFGTLDTFKKHGGKMLVQPERMSALNLSRYIRHLAENHQRTDRFEIALWSKLFYPLTILVMMALALPFAYLHVRSGTTSFKVFSGIMIGVIFYALNKLFSHLGLLGTWPPIVVAALPGTLVLAVALGALYWVERR